METAIEETAKKVGTRDANKSKNKAKAVRISPKINGVTYLVEGVTGKEFNERKRETNISVKVYRSNVSQCIKDAILCDKGYFEALKLSNTQLKSLLRPSVLLEHATNYELLLFFNSFNKIGYIRFNVWGVLTMIKRELDNKKVNPNAVSFFDAIKNENMVELKLSHNKAHKSHEAKKAKKTNKVAKKLKASK